MFQTRSHATPVSLFLSPHLCQCHPVCSRPHKHRPPNRAFQEVSGSTVTRSAKYLTLVRALTTFPSLAYTLVLLEGLRICLQRSILLHGSYHGILSTVHCQGGCCSDDDRRAARHEEQPRVRILYLYSSLVCSFLYFL